MDMSAQNPWLIELGDMEDQLNLLQELTEINYFEFDNLFPDQEIEALLGANTNQQGMHLQPNHQCRSPSTESTATTLTSSAAPTTTTRPSKQPRLQKHSTPSLPVILNFGSASSLPDDDHHDNYNQANMAPVLDSRQPHEDVMREDKQRSLFLNNGDCGRKSEQSIQAKRKSSSTTVKSTTTSRDHILAERRRREKITQHLIALSGLLPGLKRMDKSSVLGEAVEHIKQLKERVKTLEEENARKMMESVVPVKKSNVTFDDDDISSSGDNEEDKSDHNHDDDQMSGIEVRVWNNNLLIKLQCQRRQAILLKLLSSLEKHHLLVSSVHATPFGDRTFDITIIAQMEKEVEPQNVVADLSSLIKGF